MRTKIFKSYKKILDDKKKDELKQQIFLEKYVIDN